MLNSEFNEWAVSGSGDFYPEALREEIDAVNTDVYDNLNNGVYRCGFAASQEAYDEAYEKLFAALDRLEARLADRRFLMGDTQTEADWRLFTTLVRFDPVYVGHFKCLLRDASQDQSHRRSTARTRHRLHLAAEPSGIRGVACRSRRLTNRPKHRKRTPEMPIRKFIRLESSGGLVLMAAAAAALLLDNSPLAWLYDRLLGMPLAITVGEFGLKKPLLLWINDGLMAIFFLLVGLEIKREVLIGELSSRAKAALPLAAAVGGVAAPALVFVFLNNGQPENLAGWAGYVSPRSRATSSPECWSDPELSGS
jgi:hypothetical protein